MQDRSAISTGIGNQPVLLMTARDPATAYAFLNLLQKKTLKSKFRVIVVAQSPAFEILHKSNEVMVSDLKKFPAFAEPEIADSPITIVLGPLAIALKPIAIAEANALDSSDSRLFDGSPSSNAVTENKYCHPFNRLSNSNL